MDVDRESMVSLIRERLNRHPHFRGRTDLLHIESIDGGVIVSGRLPTYHLKQLLQEAIKALPDVEHVDNRVEVAVISNYCGGIRAAAGGLHRTTRNRFEEVLLWMRDGA